MTIQDNFLSRERAGSASNRGAPVLPGRGGGGGLAVSLRRPGLRPGKFEYIYKYLGINKLYHHVLLSLRGMGGGLSEGKQKRQTFLSAWEGMAPMTGLEPVTKWLTATYSAIELHRRQIVERGIR